PCHVVAFQRPSDFVSSRHDVPLGHRCRPPCFCLHSYSTMVPKCCQQKNGGVGKKFFRRPIPKEETLIQAPEINLLPLLRAGYTMREHIECATRITPECGACQWWTPR